MNSLPRTIVAFFCLSCITAMAESPAVFSTNPGTLVAVRQRLASGDAALQPAFDALLADAAKAMKVKPVSVLDKKEPFPGADPHDYVSYAPYFWPNPDTKDGLPYVRHDGKRNREQMSKGDASNFGKTVSAINTLGLAYGLTGREEFAEHAALLLRNWFLDPATRMNPNFTHAQAVLGVNGGRGTGLIEFAGLPHLIDALGLLKGSRAWTSTDQDSMTAWLTSYSQWIATSKEAASERNATNNHGSWFDGHEVSLLLYLGKINEARAICELAKTRRISKQIESDGHQPLEEARADGFGYSSFNVNALMSLASLAERVDVDLWNYQSPDGRGIRKAAEYLATFSDPNSKWPGHQLNEMNRSTLVPMLIHATAAYGEDQFGPALRRLPSDEVAKDRTHLMLGK